MASSADPCRLEGIVAVLPEPEALPPQASDWEPVPASDLDVHREGLEAFDRGGWVFVRPPRDVYEAVAAGESLPGLQSALEVYRTETPDLALYTRRIVAVFDPDLDPGRAGELLADAGFGRPTPLVFRKAGFSLPVPGGEDPYEALARLRETCTAELRLSYVEMLHPLEARFRPRGPLYAKQWQWRNQRQTGGTPCADIHVEPAWKLTRGLRTRIGIIDTGFDPSHVELQRSTLSYSGHMSETGASAAFQAGIAQLAFDSHGTTLAGMAAARPRSGRGLTGVAPRARLILVSVPPVVSVTAFAAAIQYLVDPSTQNPNVADWRGATVAFTSLGYGTLSLLSAEEAMIESALDDAGDGRYGLGTPFFYAVKPSNGADVDDDFMAVHENVIAVGQTDHDDVVKNTAQGSHLDFVAPGFKVTGIRNLSYTDHDGWSSSLSGTSFAVACAAGVGALVLGANRLLTAEQVRQIMRSTCDKTPGLVGDRSDEAGYGRINAAKAVKLARYRSET